MNGYDKIYLALTQGRDETWKRKVDETLARFKGQGMTELQAMKHTAMELNMEKSPLTVDGIFLKAYETRGGESLFNVVVDGEPVPVSGDKTVELPKHPSKITITNATRVKNLMTKKTWLEIDDKSEITIGGPASPEELMKYAKLVGDIPDGDYALIMGSVTELTTWAKDGGSKDPLVTPEGTNLKLNFRSGSMRTGCFVNDLDFLNGILPSKADQKKMDEITAKQDWGEAVRFFNEVCGEQREFTIAGVDILVYGKVTDNNYTSRSGEERLGKNVKVSVGGFIYSVDLLYEMLKPGKEGALEAFHADGNADGANTPTPAAAEVPASDPIREALMPKTAPPATSEVEAPATKSVEEQIMDVLNSTNGIAPPELMSKIKVNAEELSQKLTALHKAGKVILKDGKFYGKRKK